MSSTVKKARISATSSAAPISASTVIQPAPAATTTTISASATPSTSSELVHSAVYRYLQRRRYAPAVTDAYRRISHPPKEYLSQTKQAMALRELLQNEASSNNSFSFLSHNSDPVVIEQQYSRFKLWISESPDSYKPELAQLLYPVFTHLYLELVCAGHKLAASKFIKKHQSTFLSNFEFATFIRQLGNVTSPEDITRDEVVKIFMTSKYSVTLSNRNFHYLMRYLQQQDKQQPIVLQILHSKVDIRLADALNACSKVEAVERLRHEDIVNATNDGVDDKSLVRSDYLPNVGQATTTTVNHVLKKTEDSIKLQETIRLVREGATPLPSTCLYRLGSDASSVTSARISFDGCHLTVGSEDSSIQLWNLFPEHSDSNRTCENFASGVGLACRPNPLSSSSDSQFSSSSNFSDMRTNCRSVLRGHSGPVYGLAYVPGTDFLISCSEDTTMRAWDISSGVNRALFRGHNYPVWSVDVDRLGLNIATGSMDRTAKLWHLEYTFPLRVYAGHEKDVDVVRFHPNCNYLATAGADKTVRLWTHADAKMVRVFSGHRGGIYSLAFSPDGKILASAGEDRRIRLWDLATSSLLKELRGHTDTVYSLVWSADSSILTSGGLDGTVRMWNIQECSTQNGQNQNGLQNGPHNDNSQNVSAELVATYPTSCSNIINLCYSPHNTLIATGIGNGASLGVVNITKNFQMNGSGTFC